MDFLNDVSKWAQENASMGSVVAVLITLYITHHFIRHGTNFPGPILWPVFGCIPAILWNVDRLYDMSTEYLAVCRRQQSLPPGGNQMLL